MKYKLVLRMNNSGGGNPDGMTSVSFYTKASAVQAATAWAEGSGRASDLWDGSSWTVY